MQQRSIFLYGLSFLVFLTVAIIRNRSFDQMHQFTKEVEHSREVIIHLETLANSFKSAQAYSKRYEELAPGTPYYRLARDQAARIPIEIKQLRDLLHGDVAALAQLDTVQAIITRNMDVLLQFNIAELVAAGEVGRLKDFYTAESLMQAMVKSAFLQSQTRREKLDAKIFSVNILSIALSLAGMAIIVFTFLTNMRQYHRRLAVEGFLQSVLNTSQAGIISLSAIRDHGRIRDFRVDYANPAFENITGFPMHRVNGKRMMDVEPLVSLQLLEVFKQVVSTGTPMQLEKQFNDHWYFISLARKGDGLTASFQDVSALRRYQKELEASIRQLEQSNAELEEYAYVASHDLQEPLRKIQTFANYIWDRRQEVLDEKEKQYFQKLMTAAHRMSTLVRDLLSISGLRKKPEFVPTDLNQLMTAVLQDLDLLITQKQATVHTSSLPKIEAVPLQMQQLMYNLVQNALKFVMPGRKPEITIASRQLSQEAASLRSLPAGRAYIELSVCDNGIGFNNEQATQIFGLFRRLHVQELYPGSGIGLALCQRIVQNHHGVIYARGEEDKGACFYVVLPVKQEEA